MMKLARDIVLATLLFVAIIAAPFVMRAMKPDAPPKPVAAATVSEAHIVPQPSNTSSYDPDRFLPTKRISQAAPSDTGCGGLSRVGRYVPDAELVLQGNGDSIVVGGNAVTDNMATIRVSAGRGTDRLHAEGAGYADASDEHLESVEVYEIQNRQPNVVNVFASGLETTDGAHIVVMGDVGIDMVTLDPCLTWSAPVASGGFARYDAYDLAGNTASVSVSIGVNVTTRTK